MNPVNPKPSPAKDINQCSCTASIRNGAFLYEPNPLDGEVLGVSRCAHCVAADALLRDALLSLEHCADSLTRPVGGDHSDEVHEARAILSRAAELQK